MTRRSYSLMLAVNAALSGMGTGAVQAQEAVKSTLEEVVVTARKTEESQQDVPVSLTALSSETLQAQVVLSVQDLQTSVPGLFIAPNSQGGAPTFAIRGAKADNGTSPTVAVYIDDVPVASTLSVANMVYDMNSISTLKGPQGTLFGSNSTGGAVIFRPNKPTEKFEGYGEVGAGNYSRKQFQGMINVPLGEVVQLRFAGEIVRRDGFIKNLTPSNGNSEMSDDRHESARFSIRLKPAEGFVNDTVVDYYHVDDQPNQAIPIAFRSRYNYTTFLCQLPNALSPTPGGACGSPVTPFVVPVDYALAGITVSNNPRVVSLSPDPTWNKANNWGVGNTTTYDFNNNFSVKNVIGYRRDSTDSSEQNGGARNVAVDGRTTHKTEQWTWEPSFDVTFADGKLHNKTGLFLSHSEDNTGNAYRVIGLPWDLSAVAGTLVPLSATTILPGNIAVGLFYPLQSGARYKRKFDSEAIYSQTSYKLNDELTATLGLRYTWDQGKYQAKNRLAFVATEQSLGPWGNFDFGHCNAALLATYDNFDPAACSAERDYRSSAPSFTFTLEDQFSPRQMVYGTLRGGYLVGGFNNQVSAREGQTFKPERVTDVEFGLKSDWELAGQPIRTNAAVFFGTYRDQQRVQNGTTATGTTYIAVQNAGSSTFYGFDLDVTYEPFDHLLLNASWNHIIAEYTNYEASLNIPGVIASADLNGVQASQTPKDVLTASATLKWPLPASIGEISSTYSYFWRAESEGHDAPTIAGPVGPDGHLTSITNDFSRYDRLGSFGLSNFSTDWKNIFGSNLGVSAWIKNIFDKDYAIYNSNQLLQYGYATATLGEPRTYGVNVRYSF